LKGPSIVPEGILTNFTAEAFEELSGKVKQPQGAKKPAKPASPPPPPVVEKSTGVAPPLSGIAEK
jgi:hypothetical protein